MGIRTKIALLSFILLALAISIFAVSCSKSVPKPQTQPKAAIIDQFDSLYPNPQFMQEVSEYLDKAGFIVTLIKGAQITVDLYQKLPSYNYKLIIFRVHSNALGDTPQTGKTYLYTSEPYSITKYVADQLADRVLPAQVDENSPECFSISSDFIAGLSQGEYNQSVIIMMGCNSLYSQDMAKAFISRGAILYTGWYGSVKLDFVVDFTIELVKNLCEKGVSFKEALFKTANEKCVDPTYKADFGYFPGENENHSLLESNR